MIVACMCWIFSNSAQNAEESNGQSAGVAEILKPIIDPEDNIDDETFSFFIRKTAHFTEFFILGLFWTLLRLIYHRSLSFFLPLFAVLATAVCDETIQIYSGRTSSLIDVIIDFGGSFTAVIIVSAAAALLCAIRKRSLRV